MCASIKLYHKATYLRSKIPNTLPLEIATQKYPMRKINLKPSTRYQIKNPVVRNTNPSNSPRQICYYQWTTQRFVWKTSTRYGVYGSPKLWSTQTMACSPTPNMYRPHQNHHWLLKNWKTSDPLTYLIKGAPNHWFP